MHRLYKQASSMTCDVIMRLLDIPLGLLINFNVERLTEGVSRLILPGADSAN